MRNPMKSTVSKFIFTFFLLGLVACSNESPELMAPPQEISVVKLQDSGLEIEYNPQVDILFIIDNSMSMDDDQVKLSQNIDRFVAGFAQNEVLDFHIGITSVYDTQRFGILTEYDEQNNRYPNGQLRPLKTEDGQGVLLDRPPYLSRGDSDYLGVLRSSLKLGVQPLVEGGPEFEESLSPIVSAFSESMLMGPNAGFYRPEAHLAIVLITDANDLSPNFTPQQVAQFLRSLKDDPAMERFSTYGVISPTDSGCAKDPSGDPIAIEEFLHETNGRILSLCETNYGDRLADFGIEILKKATRKVIPLQHRPEFETIEVRYGQQLIPADDNVGWTYDPDQVAIIINGGTDLKQEDGAKINITYKPVDLTNLGNGRANRL